MINTISKLFMAVMAVASLFMTAAVPVSDQECSSHIVSMDMDMMPLVFQNPHGWFSAILDDSKRDSKVLYTYDNSINGFSALLTPSQLHSLAVTKGFVSSVKDRPMVLFSTRTAHFLGLNYEYGAWPASKLGEGVVIGLVDTGIWPESPSFKDFGMPPIPPTWKGRCEDGPSFNASLCNKKLIGARTFLKGRLAGDAESMILENSTRDTEGHGTHTSSIAAGNYVDGASWFGYASGMARGMAPRAALAMYKTTSKDRIGCTSDVLAAIDQAIADGVDILSISLGYPLPAPYEDPFAAATFAAMEKGILVSMAVGNEGPDMQSLQNDNPWVISVGSGTLDRAFGGTILLGNGVSVQGHATYNGRKSYQRLPIIYMDSCDHLDSQNQNKIIVCRKTSPPTVQTEGTVQIVSDPAADLQDYGDYYSGIATLLLTIDYGIIVHEYINNTAQPTASLYFQETSIGTKPAPMVWDESSRGPSIYFPTLLKPDIIAPGVMVLGSWIPDTTGKVQTVFNNTGGFNIETGTSMATPHVAGVAALLKRAHPDWSPASIRSAIMTTAEILDNTKKPIRDQNDGQVASPFAMGTGQLNPNKALDPGLIYDVGREDYVNYLCALNWTTKQIKAVVRSSSFNCSHSNLDLNYPAFIAYMQPNSSSPTRYIFHRTVTNVGEKSSQYSAELTPIKGFNLSVQPQYLEFNEKFQKLDYELTIEAPAIIEHPVVTGYLSWVNLQGGQVVRNPIVATTYILN